MLSKHTVKRNLSKHLIFKLEVMRDISLINLEDYCPIREERVRKAREIVETYNKAMDAIRFTNGNIDEAICYLRKVKENLMEEMKSIFQAQRNPWKNKIKKFQEAIDILENFKKIIKTERKRKLKQNEIVKTIILI